jgi:hypothetical protein
VRTVAFVVLAALGIATIALGIRSGDLETIHRFAAQI